MRTVQSRSLHSNKQHHGAAQLWQNAHELVFLSCCTYIAKTIRRDESYNAQRFRLVLTRGVVCGDSHVSSRRNWSHCSETSSHEICVVEWDSDSVAAKKIGAIAAEHMSSDQTI